MKLSGFFQTKFVMMVQDNQISATSFVIDGVSWEIIEKNVILDSHIVKVISWESMILVKEGISIYARVLRGIKEALLE